MDIVVKAKTYSLPIFLPDGTHAAIKGMDPIELMNSGIKGMVTNTYHLLTDNVVETISQLGGIKSFMNYEGLVLTDSGGFQAMSLVRKNKHNGKFDENGVTFKNPKNGSKLILTPEVCIDTQLKIKSDIVMLLDDCTDPRESESEQKTSVRRTIAWAKRGKNKFTELTKDLPEAEKPLLFAIIQGGNSKELRKQCADALIEIGFDGYAYGGWPLDDTGFLEDILTYTASLMPNDKPKYAMGVGKPTDILKCYKMGYNMFDCVIPTRDARHARMYLIDNSGNLSTLNLSNKVFENDKSPIDCNCNCYSCKNFSKAYLRYLYKTGEVRFNGLASIHNLATYSKLVERLK